MAAAADGLHLHVDALGGVAGDMLLAALLDLDPSLVEGAQALARAIGPGLTLVLDEATDGGLRGRRLRFEWPGRAGSPATAVDRGHDSHIHDHDHHRHAPGGGPDHDHDPTGTDPGHHTHDPASGPRHFADYLAALQAAAPDEGTAVRASDILHRLGRAEAAVHGVPLERVHFHEVADWDSVADVLLCAWALERVSVATASTAPLPLGSGRVRTEHGPMPVPAPAALDLLRGLPLIDDGVRGERITPTGAALLAHLAPAPALPAGPWNIDRIGTGLGQRRLPGIANALRLSLYRAAPQPEADRIGTVTFTVDDQTAEDLAIGLDRLRAHGAVLDVLQIPAFGKKGRLTARIEVLCRPGALSEVADLCLRETTTLGVRLGLEGRRILSREADTRDGIAVKTARRPGGAHTVKAEADDIAAAGDHAAREAARRRAERGD